MYSITVIQTLHTGLETSGLNALVEYIIMWFVYRALQNTQSGLLIVCTDVHKSDIGHENYKLLTSN